MIEKGEIAPSEIPAMKAHLSKEKKGARGPAGQSPLKWGDKVSYQGKPYILFDYADQTGKTGKLVTPKFDSFVTNVPWQDLEEGGKRANIAEAKSLLREASALLRRP